MKKLLVIVATLVLAMACTMLVACGGVEGTYKFSSMKMGDVTVKAGEEYRGQKLDADSFVITLEKDGVLKVTEGEMAIDGTWKVNDEGKYELKVDDSTMVAEISGGKLTYTMHSVEYVFEK